MSVLCAHVKPKELTVKRGVILILLALLLCTSLIIPQDVDAQIPDNAVAGLSGIDVSRLIFLGERESLRRLQAYSPVIEMYLQSLWPDTLDQIPIDDAYVLAKIDLSKFMAQEDDSLAMLFGTAKQWRVRTDNGGTLLLYRAGIPYFLFIDVWDFDADTYRLAYIGPERLGAVECMKLTVTPLDPRTAGRFQGTIWVEKSKFKIVRAQGTFKATPVKLFKRLNPFGGNASLNFHFDCWREQIAADLWAPAHVIVDDNIPWKAIGGDGATDLHIRARLSIWGYANVGSFEARRRELSARNSDPVMTGLEADGLIAPPGDVDAALKQVLHEACQTAGLQNLVLEIRILLTTPIELFHVGHIIVVSRGLLEMAPDRSTLEGLLADELAHLVADAAPRDAHDYSRSLFVPNRSADFGGLEVKEMVDEAEAARVLSEMASSGYEAAFAKSSIFVTQLRSMSPHIPNLTKACFGATLLQRVAEHDTKLTRSSAPPADASPLSLRSRYIVDVSTGALRLLP